MLLHISFPRKGRTYRVEPSPRLAGVPWNVGTWGPRTCLLRELQEGTGEHTEVLTGCDLRMRDRLRSRAGPVSALSFCPGAILWLWPFTRYQHSPVRNAP